MHICVCVYVKLFSQESDQHWAEIKNGMYWFGRKPALAAALRAPGAVTAATLLQFFDTFVAASSATRCKFSSQFYGADKRFVKSSAGAAAVELVRDPALFRRSKALLPVPDFAPL